MKANSVRPDLSAAPGGRWESKVEDAALILEGGSVRGLFTAGALDYLMEQRILFSHVTGVSAGACNAVNYLAGQQGRMKLCMIPKDKQSDYRNHKNMWKRKSLFDMDMMFDDYPNEIYPFEYETYFSSPAKCEMVVTNCVTGQAEYLDERCDKKRLMDICRASSSLPFVSPMVWIDGIPYLDGSAADSIPIRRTLKLGYQKHVVILTRNAGYRKSLSKKGKRIYIAAYGKYPELVKDIYYRARVYNKTLEYIEKMEQQGRIFVIRPRLAAISKLEKDSEKLEQFYRHGYEMMEEQFEAMMQYVNDI